MSFTIQVRGTKNILRATQSLSKEADRAVERGVKKAVAFLIPELRKEIRRLQLIKTGAYFRNVATGSLSSLVKKIGQAIYEGRIRNQMEYADFLEGGTLSKGKPKGIRAYKVYENTLKNNSQQVMRIFNNELSKVR